MQYDITIIRQDRTDLRPMNFQATRGRLMFLLLMVVGLPVGGFLLSYYVIAPQQLGEDVELLKQRARQAESSEEEVGAQFDAMAEENMQLRDKLNMVSQQRAELEAKLTIVETARQEAGDKAMDMEEKLMTLQRRLKFYEQFVKPANEQAPMQCFNINAALKGDKITYGVNFMKNDQKDKKRVNFNVAFRVLAGAKIDMIDPAKVAAAPPLHERETGLTKDVRLTGSFKVGDAKIPEGLRLLDIRAFDDDNHILAQCWKAF